MNEKVFTQTHVTALEIIEPNYILEGSGGILSLYDIDSNKLLEELDLFHGSRIHGIQKSDSTDVVVFGGKHLAVLEVSNLATDNRKLNLKKKLEETDWIQDAKLVDDGENLVLLTSHNKVIIRKLSSTTVIKEIQCDERCILYCGKFIGDFLEDLVVLSGTVFGEILVWSAEANQEKQQLFHRLSGHNGVIFSVNFDETTSTIISTSDDRSIRTWKMSSKTNNQEKSTLVNLFLQSEICAQHELYGHEARVWNSTIIRNSVMDSGQLVSLGEDSRICLWDLESGQLNLKFEAHPGASVWSSSWSNYHRLLVTGGGDGSVRLWNTNRLLEASCRLLPFHNSSEIPRMIAIAGGYLSVTDQGAIYGWSPNDRWIRLHQDQRLQNGCVMDVRGETIIFGTRLGAVLVFSMIHSAATSVTLEVVDDQQLRQSKIFSIHLIGSNQFIVCFADGFMELRNIAGAFQEATAQFVLPSAKQRWPSCARIINGAILIGDREGSLHLYSPGEQVAKQSFSNIHGKNGLTDIQPDENDDTGNCFYTAGKDGRVGLWRLVGDSQLELLSIIDTSLGWIARLMWIDNDLIYLAFHSDQFVVWSSRQQMSLMKVTCGGGHRSWDFSVTLSSVTFLFVKDKQIYESCRPRGSVFHSTLAGKCGGHSKTTCRAQFIRSDNQTLILTGSEDTTLRISGLSGGSLRCLTTIPKHISSVRALAVHEISSKGMWLCLSAGGRAQLSAGLLRISGADEKANVIYHDVRTHYLRGLSSRRSYKPWLAQSDMQLVADPETRYMDVNFMEHDANHFYVFAACSDAFIRVFDLMLDTRHMDLFHELSFHNCCVLKVQTLRDVAGNWILLSAGTDGRLAFWNISALVEDAALEPFGSLSIHQSGINSLSCRWIDGRRLMILSGGDDNALIYSEVEVDCVENTIRLVRQKATFPHAAQISGVAILDGNLAVSVSLDQRLILWRMDGADLVWVSTTCCDVSDIQGLDVLRDPSGLLISVYGQGIQIMRVNSTILSGID